MLACVAIWGGVATSRSTARLTRAQMHPMCADLHAFFTLVLLWMFYGAEAGDMGTRLVTHDNQLRSSSIRFHFARSAAALYVLVKKAVKSASGEFAVRTASYGRRNSEKSEL